MCKSPQQQIIRPHLPINEEATNFLAHHSHHPRAQQNTKYLQFLRLKRQQNPHKPSKPSTKQVSCTQDFITRAPILIQFKIPKTDRTGLSLPMVDPGPLGHLGADPRRGVDQVQADVLNTALQRQQLRRGPFRTGQDAGPLRAFRLRPAPHLQHPGALFRSSL